jgi:hypothetical protein
MNTSSEPASAPGQRERQRDPPERAERRRPEPARRLDQGRVLALELRREGQDHERQQRLGQAGHDGPLGLEEARRALLEPERRQGAVHDAPIAEQEEPAVRPHDDRHEQRRDNQDHLDGPPDPGRAGERDRERVAEDQAEDRHQRRDTQRAHEDGDEVGIAELGVAGEGQRALERGRRRGREQAEPNQEEQRQDQQGQEHQPGGEE